MRKYLIRAASVLFTGLMLATFLPAGPANAIPAFARQNDLACSTCHSAWPLLNETGRKFKENGFKFARGEEAGNVISDFLNLDANFPIAAVIKARPFDKKEGGDYKLRAIHEFEIMIAGTIYKNISGFIELEGEDEENFEPSIRGWVTWNANPAFNLQLSYHQAFMADPYDTLSGIRRTTRGRNAVIDQKFGGADNNGKLRDPRQVIEVYGRPIPDLFYLVGYSGSPKDAEGVNAGNLHGKLAYDVLPELTIGAFGMMGKCDAAADNCDIDRDFQRLGFDVQGQYGNAVFHGAYMTTKDDANALDINGFLPEARNSAWYFDALYAFQKDGRPWIVPFVRIDQYEKADGAQDFTEVTMNLSYYMAQNIRIYGEWFKQVNVPDGFTKGGRFTIQIEAGF